MDDYEDFVEWSSMAMAEADKATALLSLLVGLTLNDNLPGRLQRKLIAQAIDMQATFKEIHAMMAAREKENS